MLLPSRLHWRKPRLLLLHPGTGGQAPGSLGLHEKGIDNRPGRAHHRGGGHRRRPAPEVVHKLRLGLAAAKAGVVAGARHQLRCPRRQLGGGDHDGRRVLAAGSRAPTIANRRPTGICKVHPVVGHRTARSGSLRGRHLRNSGDDALLQVQIREAHRYRCEGGRRGHRAVVVDHLHEEALGHLGAVVGGHHLQTPGEGLAGLHSEVHYGLRLHELEGPSPGRDAAVAVPLDGLRPSGELANDRHARLARELGGANGEAVVVALRVETSHRHVRWPREGDLGVLVVCVRAPVEAVPDDLTGLVDQGARVT
mmetsp:Transcript_17588/g.56319  ORF Transcript_17588/g.56319 Transcript_17588/m.56319 type:complete len:309 (-) Transcript_17588:595-1521(-)